MNAKKQRIDRREVRAWMVLQSFKVMDIQKDLGLRYHNQVAETLQGVRSDRRVLAWLRDHGCPLEYLKLPTDMQENQ